MNISIVTRALLCVCAVIAATSALAKPAAIAADPAAGVAQSVPGTPAQVPASDAAVPLATLGNLSGPLRITGASASRSLSVAVSARERVSAATLHLVATNSVSLLTERSQLAVRVNDRTIAQLPLSSRQPELTADIRVPANLLRPGYNALTFAVAQHSTENCEDPDAPELWTEIDTNASTLQLQTGLKPLTPVLADLDDLIDPKQAAGRSVAIVAATHPQNDLQLASGALLAQGVALRLRYLAPDLHVQDAQSGTGGGVLPGLALGPLAASDVLLVGTRDALRPYLDPGIAAQIGGAFLGIYPKPDDARRFVLVISGRNDEEVNLAARTFAHRELPLPRRAAMAVNGLDEVLAARYSARQSISGTRAHTFRELGFKSRTLGAADRAEFEVLLPADIYAPEDAQVTLDLNFTEGAKMRQDSVLGIFLNDRFEQVIALDQQQGAVLRHYRVSIPLRSFRPGGNLLSFRPVLVPLVSDRCAVRETRNLELTLFDDSSLKLPPASHFTTLPDLKRFAESGFPYAVRPDGTNLALRVAAGDNDTLSAAWSLLAKLAQKQGQPLTATQVTLGAAHAGRQTILVGAVAALPHATLRGAPWEPGHVVRIADASSSDAPSGDNAGDGFWESVRARFDPSAHAATQPADAALNADLPLSRQLLIMQYRGNGGDTVTVLTAANAAELADGVGRLIEPNYWENLDGDVGLLSFDRPDLWTGRSGARYEFGDPNAYDHLGFELSRHPWLGYAALILLLTVLAALTGVLLRRYYRKHHGGSQD
jgi:hypothetical protein